MPDTATAPQNLPANKLPPNILPFGMLSALHAVLARHPAVTRAVLFGSRAKGSHQPHSDIDLALEGPLNPLEMERILDALHELPFAQTFDVVHMPSITHHELLAHIHRVGICVYCTTTPPPHE